LHCHSHFNSASSEGMGLKGCSVSRKGGEEIDVNKNRLRCQSVSDDFGYPVVKVSTRIELLLWEESQRRVSSSWESSRCNPFLQAEWKGTFVSTSVVFPSPGYFCTSRNIEGSLQLYISFEIFISDLFCAPAAVTSSTPLQQWKGKDAFRAGFISSACCL